MTGRGFFARVAALILCVVLLCSVTISSFASQEADLDSAAVVQEDEDPALETQEQDQSQSEDDPDETEQEPDDGSSAPEATPEADTDSDQESSGELAEDVSEASEEILASNELALADEDSNTTTTALISSDAAGGRQLVIESYLTSDPDTQETIRPCDIIFVLDQSKWMNTETDYGAQRAAIIQEIKALLNDLAQPTTGGEHRVAIVGYGRLNMPASTDTYNASIYPGVQASGSNISLNTGYYTAGGFLSQNGWSDISQSEMSGSGLPQMADSYQAAMTYSTAFMTLDEADNVLNEGTMLAWYAGAARMDAGLTIAEQLAAIAEAQDTNNDRDLIVCLMTSSLPIQNTAYNNLSTIRTAAVMVASTTLKNEGATIFAYGDYHASGKTMSGEVQDTEENFDSTMEQVCSDASYYFSFSDYSSVTDALNAMMTQIVLVAADDAEQKQTVQTQEFTSDSWDEPITWQDILDYYGSSAQSVIASTMAQVAYYYFTGYDDDGNPTFADEPYITLSVPLSDLVSADGITYDATLIPLPNLDSGASSLYGNKVSITIASPVTVTYQWASSGPGYAPSDVALPDKDVVVLGTAHTPAALETKDVHYSFAGWYTDAACTTEYTGTSAITGNMTLYGKWDKYVLVEYYWNSWEGDYTTPDDEDKIAYGETPHDFTPHGPEGYTFAGWYLDKEYTQPYEPGPLTEDIALYAKWTEPEPVTYHVTYDGNGAEGDDPPVDETAYLSGDTVTVAPAMTWEGYVFVQWNTAQDGTGALYAPDDTFSITQDTTLYAQWEAEPEATEPPQETPPANDFPVATGVENLHPGLYAMLTASALLLGAAFLWGRQRRHPKKK
jgi:uncharacterized repeat protein (TIGR02543 family)